MNMYEWEPVEDTVYPEAIMATQTAGLFFDVLHVEMTNDGWHAMFLNFGDDDMEMTDEEVFSEELKAQTYCETYDIAKMRQKVADGTADEEEAAMLEMMESEHVA